MNEAKRQSELTVTEEELVKTLKEESMKEQVGLWRLRVFRFPSFFRFSFHSFGVRSRIFYWCRYRSNSQPFFSCSLLLVLACLIDAFCLNTLLAFIRLSLFSFSLYLPLSQAKREEEQLRKLLAETEAEEEMKRAIAESLVMLRF